MTQVIKPIGFSPALYETVLRYQRDLRIPKFNEVVRTLVINSLVRHYGSRGVELPAFDEDLWPAKIKAYLDRIADPIVTTRAVLTGIGVRAADIRHSDEIKAATLLSGLGWRRHRDGTQRPAKFKRPGAR